MKKLLIVTYYRYPDGDAGSVRQHTFAKLYKDLGYDVTIVGMGTSTNFQIKENEDVSYISLRNKNNSLFSRINNYLGFKNNLKKFLKNYGIPQVMHIVDIPANALFFLKKFATKHNIKLIHDSVEWYSPEQFKNGKRNINYILKNNYNTKWIDKQFSVIAISSFLEKHFNSRGINTVRIPVIMDIESVSCKKETVQDKTVFLYAGSPGKKDYLAEILNGFSLLSDEELTNVELRIIGIKKEQLITLCGASETTIEKLEKALVCLGRVSRKEVLMNLSQADFTVLLRSETQRYAKAGFPTKVVESLATATPVIANITSDLEMYFNDGINSFIVENDSVSAFSETIKRALKLTLDERNILYKNARDTAQKYFNYKNYKNLLKELLNKEGF